MSAPWILRCLALASLLPIAGTSTQGQEASRSEHEDQVHMLWWLPVGGHYSNPRYPSTKLTLFSPLEGSTSPDGHFVLSYGIEQPPAACYLRFQLDGEDLTDVGVQQLASSTWREHKVKAAPGNHVLTVDVLALPDSSEGKESEELMQRLMTTFMISAEPIYETGEQEGLSRRGGAGEK
eukprot:748382-Hanusia_phi.AAC.6